MRITTLPLLLLMLLGFAQDPGNNSKVDLAEEFKIKNGKEVCCYAEYFPGAERDRLQGLQNKTGRAKPLSEFP